MGDSMHILPRATNQEGQVTALVNVLNCQPGGVLKEGKAPGLVRFRHIDEMVGDAQAICQGGFGGADIQAAVEKAGVCRDNFRGKMLSQRKG